MNPIRFVALFTLSALPVFGGMSISRSTTAPSDNLLPGGVNANNADPFLNAGTRLRYYNQNDSSSGVDYGQMITFGTLAAGTKLDAFTIRAHHDVGNTGTLGQDVRNASLRLQVWSTTGGGPGSVNTLLTEASATIPADFVGHDYLTMDLTGANEITLDSNTTYGFVVFFNEQAIDPVTDRNFKGRSFQVSKSDSSVYSDGEMFRREFNGTTPSANRPVGSDFNYANTTDSAADMTFFVRGIIPPPPEPTFWELADQRIEQHRKNDINVTVVDPQGNPVPSAPVRVKMTRHGFVFGTAVSERYFWDVDPDSPYVDENPDANAANSAFYREKILGMFNQITIENGLKWHKWEDSIRKPKTLGLLDWAQQNQMPVRAHTMVWGRDEWDTVPPDVSASRTNATFVNDRINGHIADIGNHPSVKGKVIDWDVLNEPMHETALNFLNTLYGSSNTTLYKNWFDRAKAADPAAKLYINEFEILMGTATSLRQNYYNAIQNLKNAGAPVEGIGMQAHFWGTPPTIEEIKTRYDTFAQLGLPMKVTEFDTYGWGNETQQGDFLRDFLKLTFSIPAVEGFTMWGFWDSRHWQNSGPLYKADKSLKVGGQHYTNLVFNTWWTDQSSASQPNGTFSQRGFLGNYDLIVTRNGVDYTKQVTLNRGTGAGNFTVIAGLSTLYEAWAGTRFTAQELANPALEATVWGSFANPDADSHNNLLEMLFGTNPKLNNTTVIAFNRVSNTSCTLDFPRSETFPTAHLRVQWSTNLSDWSSAGVVLSSGSVSNGIVPMQAVITTAPQTEIFLRIAAGDFP